MEGVSSWFSYVVDKQDKIIEATIDHARIVVIVVVCATLFSVALGIFVQKRPLLRAIALSTAGIFLTIPSLAFFALLIPLVGIGNTPAMIALFLYALLPILTNTVAGLDDVDPAIIESAKGMGLNAIQRLFQIKLPLAWPVIMAGVRISSLLTTGLVAIAVLVGGDGLGEFIQGGLTRLGLPGSVESVWVGTIFTVLLGLALDTVLAFTQRITTSRGLKI